MTLPNRPALIAIAPYRLAGLARAAALGVVLLSAGGSVMAQATAASAAVSPAKRELVAKALSLQKPGIESIGQSMINQPVGQVLQVSGQIIQRLPAEKRDSLAREVEAEVKKFHDEVAPMLRASAVKLAPSTLGASLEEKFTEDELKTLIQWLESPVNKKFQQMAVESQQGLMQKIAAETKTPVEAKLKALQDRLSEKFRAVAGVQPGASGPAPKPAAKK